MQCGPDLPGAFKTLGCPATGPDLQSRGGVREFTRVLSPADPVRMDRLVVDGYIAVHHRAGGRLTKQVVERLALAVIERAEHLVLDR
jgi:hypothetical protein